LFDKVRSLGMQVGLWVEPEMVNLDSDLVREHPDWLLSAPDRLPLPWRRQQVLDLARAEAFGYLLERLDALVTEYRVDYLKWDHNRDLHQASHEGRAGVHAQTAALYRLLDALRDRHPGLEIESCASGGGRVDLGILERTDRVWASDTNDALERQQIQRWTGLLLPPELVGAHVGPPRAHTTGRVVDLGMRLLTSLFGHAGIEWDITGCTPQELDRLRAWTALYRELRPLLHTGRTVRADLPGDDTLLHGVVAADGSHAVYAYVRLRTGDLVDPGAVCLPGLDGDRRYRVRLRTELDDEGPASPFAGLTGEPAWARRPEGLVLPGAALAAPGVALPMLRPAAGVLVEVTALP
jgi:alpha-galactosidase